MILALPNEILTEIFLHRSKDFSNSIDYLTSNLDVVPVEFNNTRSTHAPLLFTQVYHHWRAVVLNTTRLWSQIVIMDSERMSHPLLSFFEELGTRPLDILLVSDWVYHSPYSSKTFSHALIAHFDWVRSLIISDIRVHEVFPLQSSGASILEVLWVLDGYTTLPPLLISNSIELAGN
ncbi:hypothetical protein M422DRAFT_45813 [Sphaerobolus stellatus SS14]|nr:hypothetical protein M422DRAFT_45813 [Sphaerobolus stellatus SS14]